MATATATRLRRIFGSIIVSIERVGIEEYRLLREHTALPVHFNQECRHSHLAGGNSQIEEEYRDPSEKKEIVQFARLRNDRHMVAEAMIDREDTEDLSNDSKELSSRVSEPHL